MAAGYSAGPGGPARRLSNRAMATLCRRFTAEVRSPVVPWVLCAIGILASVALTLTTGTFGYVGGTMASLNMATGYQQFFSILALCGQFAVAAAALQAFREDVPGSRITLTIVFMVELALDLASGGMESSIITVLAVAIPYSAARHRLPKIALGFSVLIFLVVVIPFSIAYRTAVHGSVTLPAMKSVSESPRVLVQIMTSRNMTTALPSSVHLVLERLALISSPAIIVQRTPGQLGFVGGPTELVEAPFLGIVPRAIWPNKPRDLSGYEFGQEYFGLPPTYSWAAVTLVGDLYQHGGWLPVLGGMFMIGCLMRLIDQTVDVRANSHTVFLVLLLFPGIVEGQTSWLSTASAIPEDVAFFFLAVCLAFRPRRTT